MRYVCVIALVLLVGSTAHAEVAREPEPCWQRENVLPADGSRDVPLNAHVVIVGGELGDYQLRKGDEAMHALTPQMHAPIGIIDLELGRLEPGTDYTVTLDGNDLTTFTTASFFDTIAPPEPAFNDLRIADKDTGPRILTTLDVGVGTAMLAAIVRTQEGGPIASFRLPRAGFSGQRDHCVHIDLRELTNVCIELRAIDIAGNLSTPITRCAMLRPQKPVAYALPTPAKAPMPRDWVTLVVGSLFIIGFGIALVLLNQQRAYKRANEAFQSSEPALVHRAVAASIARGQQKRSLVGAALSIAAITAILGVSTIEEVQIILLTAPVLLLVLSIGRYARLRSALELLHQPVFDARYDGKHYMFVVTGRSVASWFTTWPISLANANNEQVLPRARINP